MDLAAIMKLLYSLGAVIEVAQPLLTAAGSVGGEALAQGFKSMAKMDERMDSMLGIMTQLQGHIAGIKHDVETLQHTNDLQNERLDGFADAVARFDARLKKLEATLGNGHG